MDDRRLLLLWSSLPLAVASFRNHRHPMALIHPTNERSCNGVQHQRRATGQEVRKALHLDTLAPGFFVLLAFSPDPGQALLTSGTVDLGVR